MTHAVQLGDIIQLRKGKKATEVHDRRVNGAMPYIQIDEVRGAAPQKFASDTKGVIVTPADLCIVWDGANAGTVGYGVDGLIGSTVARMRIKVPGEWDTEFVGRLLQSRFRQLNDEAQARGATIPHVDKAKLEAIALPQIDRSEQRRIAAILALADGIRLKREQMLHEADKLINSMFLDLFGNPATNPKRWPQMSMDQLGDVQGGVQVSRKRESLPVQRPYLRVANVYRDRLWLDEIKTIGVTTGEFSRVELQTGDVLIVEGHGNPEEIGRAAVWDGSIKDCVHQNHLIRFRAKRSLVLPEYVSRMLNSQGGRRQLIEAGRTTSGLNTISTKKVKEVLVPVPPIDLQERFVQFLSKQKITANRIKREGARADSLFGAISSRAFRGEL